MELNEIGLQRSTVNFLKPTKAFLPWTSPKEAPDICLVGGGGFRPELSAPIESQSQSLARCKSSFGWCKRLFGDLCSLGPKDLLHHTPLKALLGIFSSRSISQARSFPTLRKSLQLRLAIAKSLAIAIAIQLVHSVRDGTPPPQPDRYLGLLLGTSRAKKPWLALENSQSTSADLFR